MTDLFERLGQALSGRYTIDREVGAGGMATVYLAQDLKHDRPVALKILRPEIAAVLGPERFVREITITAGLNHPHILPLLDSGEAAGFLFYVMPFVDGESLRDRLHREKQLPLEEAIRLTNEVADALGSAHRRGIIHRDIKPENILLEEGHAVVADFGIARAMSAAGGDRLTETGLAVGTPAYMSPEQMGGESHGGERSDVYSLGCVAYEMIAGEPPFTGPTIQAMLSRKAAGEMPSLRTVRNDVTPSVERAVARALSKIPSERFATAPEFASALAAPASPSVGARRRRVALWVAGLVGLVVSLALLGVLPGTVRPAAAGFFAERDRVVVADFANDTDQPALGLAIREAVTTDLEQSRYINVVERNEINSVLQRMRLSDTTHLDVDIAVEVARRQGYPAVVAGGVVPLGVGYQLSVRIIETSTGEVAVRLRETAKSDDDVLEAVEELAHLARRHLGESLASVRRSRPLPTVTTPSLEALQYLARAADQADRGYVLEAIPLAVQAVELDTAFAAAHRALGMWYYNTGSPAAAQTHIDRAHRHDDRLPPRERYLIGSTYNSFLGDLDSTAYYYGLLLDLDPNDATALNNLGDLNERLGRYEQALRLYRRAAAVGGTVVGHLNLASAARTLGLHELADSTFTVMLERFPNVWLTWNTQIQNAMYAGDYPLAETIAADMARSEFPFPNVFAAYVQASLAARRGHISASVALADSATRLAVDVSTQFRYRPLITAQYAALAADRPEMVVPLLERTPEPEELGSAPGFEYRVMGHLASGYALADRRARAERLLARMDSLARAVSLRPPGIGEKVRAILALNAGRPDESLVLLERARTLDYGLLHHSNRLLLAQTYEALGRFEDAAAHYDSLTSTYHLNYQDVAAFEPILPIAHERAAHSYLALTDTVRAVTHLSEFVDLWEDAEPPLQRLVSDSKALLARLVGESRR